MLSLKAIWHHSIRMSSETKPIIDAVHFHPVGRRADKALDLSHLSQCCSWSRRLHIILWQVIASRSCEIISIVCKFSVAALVVLHKMRLSTASIRHAVPMILADKSKANGCWLSNTHLLRSFLPSSSSQSHSAINHQSIKSSRDHIPGSVAFVLMVVDSG